MPLEVKQAFQWQQTMTALFRVKGTLWTRSWCEISL